MSNGDIFFYTHYKVSKKSIIIQIDIELSSSSHSDVAAPPLPDISVYPNPAQISQGFTLETEQKHSTKLGIYNIKGLLGRCLCTDVTGKLEVNNAKLEGLSAGINLIKARNRQDLKAKKLVLIR